MLLVQRINEGFVTFLLSSVPTMPSAAFYLSMSVGGETPSPITCTNRCRKVSKPKR